MPLRKLFQKRTSLKDKKPVPSSKQEGERSETNEVCQNISVISADRKEEQASASILESNSVLEIDTHFELTEDQNVSERTHLNTEHEKNSPKYRKSSNSSEESGSDTLVQMTEKTKASRHKIRSFSLKEVGAKDAPYISGRRKFGSDGGIINSSTDDEGFGEKLIQLKEKDLEKVIGECVNKLIRDSIATAVSSVNIENLYEEVIKNISDRSQSESSSSSEVIKQRLHTNSITEYIDLNDEQLDGGSDCCNKDSSSICDNAKNEVENIKSMDKTDCTTQDEQYIYDNEAEEIKDSYLDGYQADIDESLSCMSLPLESSTDNLKLLKAQFELTADDKTSNTEKDDDEAEKTSENAFSNILDEPEYGEINETKTVTESKSEPLELEKKLNTVQLNEKIQTQTSRESLDLINMSIESDGDSQMMTENESTADELTDRASGLGENLPEQQLSTEEEKKVKWKVGYLHVKLPHKARGKGHLKVWKKRCVSIQPDDFVSDPNNPCFMISVYSGESGVARKHSASFWKSVSGKKAVVYRSSSRTHPYAFTISEDNKVLIHLATESESSTQEWMATIRTLLWPPSPVVQLEKMLNGSGFEISIIDNEFAFHAGLLGMYGYLTITPKKLILVHPQQGYVIQEWYLNTVDKFQLMPQIRIEDAHKVLAMTTCSDSSTGRGELLIFCNEAVALLQSLASTIHQILTYHSKQEGGKYQKELEEMAEWLVPPQTSDGKTLTEDFYKVPPRQVKSLLDIPNFIFDKPLSPVASVVCSSGDAMDNTIKLSLKTNPATASHDSGISAGNGADDFLNCSVTSFVVGGGLFPGKSSDSELSDAYTPPPSPSVKSKHDEIKEEPIPSTLSASST